MTTKSCRKRTEKDISDLEAALIVAHGEMTGGHSRYKGLTKKYGKLSLHSDLKVNSFVNDARMFCSGVENNRIKFLNFADP
jgi:hypothetical protein